MKIEARILVSRCSLDLCVSAILRGVGFDTLLIARTCPELCERIANEGYRDELRYSTGDCTCGLPKPPRTPVIVEEVSLFLEKFLNAARTLKFNRFDRII